MGDSKKPADDEKVRLVKGVTTLEDCETGEVSVYDRSDADGTRHVFRAEKR